MATKETAFSLEITVSPVLTHEDGTTEDVGDIKTLQEQFKDFQAVQSFLCNETYFHLQGVCTSKKELLLKCYVLSDSELTDLENAIDHLGQELTKYVISCGLETELSLPHDSDIKLSLELELRKQYIRQGRTHFMKISESKQDEKNPVSKKKGEKGNEQHASKSGTLSSVGVKNRKRKGTNDRNGADGKKGTPAEVKSATPAKGGSETVATVETVTSVPDKTSTEETGPDLESQHGSGDRENQSTSTDKILERSDETGKRKGQSQSELSNNEHLSGIDMKREKVEDGSTALKPEDSVQRGSHESIRRGVEEPVILKKEVLLYIPTREVKKKHIKDVFADFSSKVGRHSYVRMTSLDENMWTSVKVDFSPDVEEYFCGIRILHHSFWYPISGIQKKCYNWRAMGSSNIFRCIEGMYDYEEGFCAHVRHILLNIQVYGYKDALMQIEDLTKNIFKDCRNIDSIFKLMKNNFEHGMLSMSPGSLSALGYVYSKLSVHQDYIKSSKWVTPTICKSILKGFKAISVKDIPSTMMSAVMRIAESLCQVAFPKSPCHFFKVLEYCFHLFSLEYFSELLRKSVLTKPFKVHDVEYVRSVLRGTYSLVSTDDEPTYCQFLEKLLQHLPLEFVLEEEENVSFFKADTRNIIRMKVENESTSLMKTRNIVEMLVLYEVLSKWEKVEGDIARCLEQKVIGMCETTHKTLRQDFDCQNLQTLLLADNLFVEPSSRVEVMKLLAESDHKMLHALFTEMLQHDFLDGCTEDPLPDLTQKWFEKAIQSNCSDGRYVRPIDDLPHVYEYLGCALSAACVSCNSMLVQCLKERAFKFLNTIDVQSLVDKLLETDLVQGSHSQGVFTEHLQSYLFEGKQTDMMGIILSKAGSTSWIGYSQSRTYSKLYEKMLVKCIERCGLQETENDETCFLLMLKNADFWTNLLKVAEQFQFLKTNDILRKAHRTSVQMAQKLCLSSLPLLFSKKLHAAVKDGFSKCTKMLLVTGIFYKKEDFDEALSLLPEAKRRAEIDEQFISNILNKLRVLFGEKWPDLDIAFRMFKEMQKKVKEGSVLVSGLLDHSFWGPFCDVLRSREHISEVSRSQSFWKISETVINQWLSSPDMLETVMPSSPEHDICKLFGEDRIEDDYPYVTMKVIELLKFECKTEYENIWKPLFDGSDPRIGEIHPLLGVEDSLSEQSVAECHFGRKLQDWVKKAVHMFDRYLEYSATVEILRKVLKILNLQAMEETFAKSVQAFTALEKKNVNDLTLSQLFETGLILSQINEILQGELSNILEELSKSSNLVDFLRETALEDLRNLIDAVEEHSEQSVQESTVSALISVKRFLSPILRETPCSEVKHVLTMLQKSLTDSKITNLDQKISECNTHLHSLKALFHNVANRGEVTKEIVKKAVQQGSKYVFTLSKSGCDLSLKYRSHSTTRTHTHSDISDLRSRVMLMNTDVKETGKVKKQDKIKEDFTVFKQSVDDAMNIASILTELSQSGHPGYPDKYSVSLNITDLQQCATEYGNTLLNWQTALRDSRNKYYWLNFFYPEQLRQIENHFKAIHSKVDTEISDLLSFTGYDFKHLSGGNDIYSHVQKDVGRDAFGLKSVGKTLEILFQGKTTMFTPFPDAKSGRVADAVQEGELFLVGLNDDSDLVVPTLLALYKNTTGCLPISSLVLFCQEDTLWEDIELLIRRCLGAKKEKKANQLFSIVCVENLSSELQFRLVDILETMEEESYLLAIICRGNAHHPFLDHFGENVHQVQPMSQSAMEECLQTLWPDVVTVLSDVPGQGKSEYVQRLAWSKHKRVCSLHVSGEMTPKELVKKMSQLDMTSSDLLHIDIGMLSKPKEVDLLLTQLIVLGFVSHGSDLVKLTTKTICIEVANTISNSLRNSLNTVLCFKREVLKWQNYANFCVSNETCSPVQVVCHYLQAYDTGKLDTNDLYFTGEAASKPLPQQKCTEMLKKHFSSGTDMSFVLVRTFLNVLADQLKKFSCSYFFRTTNISGMLGGDAQLKDVKSQLFRALLDVSREFATRSVHACREDQTASVLTMSQSSDINQSVKNLKTMIQWKESNHLLIAFHNQDIQTLSALYREKSLVPKHVKTLFETQVKAAMPEFSNLSQTELQDMLQRIARFKPGATSDKVKNQLSSSYALTPDNLLKMILIILRTRAHVPVIIMGETGCGKTCLIRYLSVICGVDLEVRNIHAGIAEDEIIRGVMEVNEKALNSLDDIIWLFLDEINTCNHLGLINTILCHHTCHGVSLAPNLVVMAACNPYKIRSDQSIFTAGLETKVQADEMSRLVYRVNPLPESMVDFVWDYGSLSDSDEKAYIKRMITGCVQQSLENCVVALLVMSQKFIRDREHSGSCVSLRDVSRCRKLIDWFKKTLKEKEKLMKKCFSPSVQMEKSSVVLALAHSYHSRLPDSCSRQTYRLLIAKIFAEHQVRTTDHDILTIIQEEQRDILNRMVLPQGTAKNTALQENVFVILVCILNHIPVFVVGKPGCSKSLSLQLIKSNLRGKDSKDPYFQSLPQLFCVSYQGSESSTSDGILKVFAKAEIYKENDKDNSVLPVVILDEIGLAEMSRFNPLKVLHSLLEPGETELPNVAVVGISNWALDAAKMNRAIHLSRPDMDAEELYLTGISISETSVSDYKRMSLSSQCLSEHCDRKINADLVRAIANAYLQYTGEQTFKNFHGLRDFYSLVKYVSKAFSSLSDHDAIDSKVQLKIIMKGLLRNFGGLSSEIHSVLTVYRKHLEQLLSVNCPEIEDIPSVLELVAENISDKAARHLLLSTRGESALSIIEDLLTEKNRKFVSILGSHFEEDLTDDYNYRILSKIILCMEQGVVLILKDLENIYGSLYDMLNQNYTIVGSKKNCRIALGAYSNPLCHVHDDFRCIVLVEDDKLDLSDPPFLNRFEKQYMKLTELLSPTEMKAVSVLEDWVSETANIQGHTFTRCDVIPIDSPDMVASLVHFVYSKQNDEPDSTAHMNMCKRMILTMCSPEAVVRMDLSELQKKNPNEVNEPQDIFFHLPVHNGLAHFLKARLEDSECCLKEIIFTHSNLHTNVSACMEMSTVDVQSEKLSAFKAEKQLCTRLGSFWSDPSKTWLVIQCSASTDQENILLMKSVVDREHADFISQKSSEDTKHVMIVMHMDRNDSENTLSFVNFLSGWNMTLIDSLDNREIALQDLLNKRKIHLIHDRRPITSFLKQHLFWAFTLLDYCDIPRSLESLKDVVNAMVNDSKLMMFLEELVSSTLEKQLFADESQCWQLDVACDRLKLYNFLTLHDALEHEVSTCIKHPLAALVYKIEAASAWDSVTLWGNTEDKDRKRDVWLYLTRDKTMIDTESVPPPEGPECYVILDSVLSLRCPFSKVFIDQIETLKEPFMDAYRAEYSDFDIDEVNEEITDTLTMRFQPTVSQAAMDMFGNTYTENQFSDYFYDFCNVIFSGIKLQMTEQQRQKATEMSVLSRFTRKGYSFEYDVCSLHITCWLFGPVIESEVKLIDVCLDLTETQMADFLQSSTLSINATLSEPQKQANEGLEEVSSDTSEEHAALEKYEHFIQDEDAEEQPYTEHTSSEVDVTDIKLESETKSDDEICYQREDNLMQPTPDEMQREDQPASDKDESEMVRDKLSNGDEQPCADDCEDVNTALVSFACQELVPTEKLLSRLNLNKWISGVNLVLSHARQVSQSKVFLSLRMCSDFTYVVLVPFKLPISYLHRFGQALKSDTLESRTVFNIVCELAEELLKTGSVPCSVLQHFYSIYISNCLAADTETSLLDWTFESLQNLSIFELSLDYFGPTIFQTMLIEIESDILGEENVVDASAVLQCLEHCIETFKDNGEPDSELACLVLDVLQTNFCPQCFPLDSDTIEKVLKCDKIFKSDGLSLHHLFALSYLKNFLIHLASELNKGMAMDLHIIQKIHGIFSCDESDTDSLKNMRTKSLQTFLLKVITQGPGLKKLDEVVSQYSSEWPFVSEFQMKDEHRFLALELCPMEMTCPDVYTRVLDAYDLLPKDSMQIKKLLQSMKSNPEIVYGVFAIALQKIYVVQSVQKITDTERNEKVKEFWKECHVKLSDNQRQMFTNLCTMEDFAFLLLQTNPNKSSEDHHLSMCILHLICSILAFNANYGTVSQKSPFWLRCIHSPKDLQKIYLPGCGYNEGDLCCSTLAPLVTKKTKYVKSNCSCKSVTIHDMTIEDPQCSICEKPLEVGDLCRISTMDSTGHDRQGYIFVDIGCLKSEYVSVGSLSPAAFRVLQLLVHGCYCASLALKFTTKKELSKSMDLPESVEPSSYIENHLHVHWCALKQLTALGDSQLAILLNFIIKDCMPLIARHNVQFHSREERESYEKEFTTYVDKVMEKRFQIVQDETKQYHAKHPESTASRHELLLAEIPGDGDRLANLPRLMRDNILPTTENLKREFNILKQVHEFPMMGLLFDRMKHISLLQHLIPIVKWHMCVIRLGSHKLTRMSCRTVTVQDFIHTPQQRLNADSKKAELQKKFETFMKSWNTLKDYHDDLKTYNQHLPELKRIHPNVFLQDCLVMTKQSPMMQLLLALQAIQNDFLSDAAVLCLSTNSLSIGFLKTSLGVAVIPEVQLQHLNSKQVTRVPDLKRTTKFSQINTKFGHGRERHYDMYQIETQVVDECVLSKPVIKIGSSFPLMNFAGESLHKTDELFESVSRIVGHNPVDKDLKNSILQVKEKSPSNMHILLDYLQMTFSLLNRTPVSGSDKSQYLSEFLQTWQSLFPNRVKEVDGLCSRIRLSQIISVYELTEDIVADVIFDGLEEKYRSELPEECSKQLSALVQCSGSKFQEALISALKKIVFRYIQSGFASQDDQLSPFLMEKTLWPQGVYEDAVEKSRNADAGLLHDTHCIGHIHCTIVSLAKHVQEIKVKEEKRSSMFQTVPKQMEKTQQRKKKALEFRGK